MANLEVKITVDEERLKELKNKLNELKKLIPIRISVAKTKAETAPEKKFPDKSGRGSRGAA